MTSKKLFQKIMGVIAGLNAYEAGQKSLYQKEDKHAGSGKVIRNCRVKKTPDGEYIISRRKQSPEGWEVVSDWLSPKEAKNFKFYMQNQDKVDGDQAKINELLAQQAEEKKRRDNALRKKLAEAEAAKAALEARKASLMEGK